MKETKEKVAEADERKVAGEQAQEKVDENIPVADEGKDEVDTSQVDELAEAKDKYLRLYSEFENFRRRTSKEKLDLISTANKELMADLLPVLDDFERAMSASESSEDMQALREGVLLIQTKMSKTLESKGLEKMKIEKGDDFDDDFHEAITQIPAEEKMEGKIVDVVEPGYKLGEKVVRFAKVVVGAKQ